MIKIGILGDIGSGKSLIAKNFGYPVFNADKEVANIYRTNKKCFFELKKQFPKHVFSFPIRKQELINVILDNKRNLKKLNKIVHPIVRIKLKKFFKKNKKKKFVILDIPLLIENKIYNKDYILIFIQAKRKEILKRLKLRKNYNYRIFKKLNSLQLNLEYKRKKSNYIIKNNFKKNTIKKSIKSVKNKILK